MLLVLAALVIAARRRFAVNEGMIDGTVTQGADRNHGGTPAVNVYVYLYNAPSGGR